MGASCSVDGLSDELVQLAQSHADSLREKGVTTDELLGPAMSLYIDALRCTQKPEVTPIETAAAFSKAFKVDILHSFFHSDVAHSYIGPMKHLKGL